MSEMMRSINHFVDVMLESKDKFDKTKNLISSKENDINKVIQDVYKDINQYVKDVELEAASNSDIKELLNLASAMVGDFIRQQNKALQETSHGMKFIENFEKSFIVTVFGKVKSGKSTLGNLIMGNPLRNNHITSKYDSAPIPEVTVYDKGKLSTSQKLEEMNDFEVKATEATSSIQWFNLGGLSWFDTPGVGSITKENEELAKEYVKNADLVIFTCNSDSPGTTQDFIEMHELYSMDKPVLLLITMSDTVVEDEDDLGNIVQECVPKTDKDRGDQENYVNEQLSGKGMSDILKYSEIRSISVKLAERAIREGNELLFQQSNLGLLYKKLVDITENESAKMKLCNPAKRINKFIADLVSPETSFSFSTLKNGLQERCRELLALNKDVSAMKSSIFEKVKADCQSMVISEISKFKARVDKERSVSGQEISETISTKIDEIVDKATNEELGKFFTKAGASINIAKSSGFNIQDMKITQDTISYTVTDVDQEVRDPRGLEHIPAFFGKTYYKTVRTTRTEYKTFDVGNNETEILSDAMKQINSMMSELILPYLDEIINSYFKPIENLNKNMTNRIQMAIDSLSKMRC